MKPLNLLLALTSLAASFGIASGQTEQSWAEANKNKKGSITAWWHESRPFIYKESSGEMKGIEYDVLQGFPEFVKQKYGIDLTIEWKEAQSFSDTYSRIKDHDGPGRLGVSAFSITEKRKNEVDFTPSYMSDISVLITSEGIPIMKDMDEFNDIIPRLTAITIKETTYEEELTRLQNHGKLSFRVEYIPSSQNIMKTIATRDSSFGFIDLPVYMLLFNENHPYRQSVRIFFPSNAKAMLSSCLTIQTGRNH